MSSRIFAQKCLSTLASLPMKYTSGTRTMSIHATKKFKKLKELQVAMQCDDGVPVYLKGGTRDKVLLGMTYFLMAIGGIDSLAFIYRGTKKS